MIDWLKGSDRLAFTNPEWLRGFAHRVRAVDASGLTVQQLETLVLEMDLHFGVPVGASAVDQESSGPVDIQAAFDRIAEQAETTAGELERARRGSVGEQAVASNDERRLSHGSTVVLLVVGTALIIGGTLMSGMALGWAGVVAGAGGMALGVGMSRAWRSARRRRWERHRREGSAGLA